MPGGAHLSCLLDVNPRKRQETPYSSYPRGNTKLRTGTQGLQEWQKKSSAEVIANMRSQLGTSTVGN